ncbi:hypothetical protein VPLG_00117 [Vibrio phage eugene 12A10]|uniref:hypothetical protein n=1 Tax=Vibrio phage eugene 12A10 TaxID=573172 RepID=UPI0003518A48|nr:hypothetical protein VPLG_00117 [Vibrio phage eugene 12A10]AGN51556.1 hypothetical protein VPLG_00117 [Vibrio phage eugene 12A10]
MNDEEKLKKMFMAVHGDIDANRSSCYLRVVESEEYDTYGEPAAIEVCKDGSVCWTKTKTDILFDYITKDWES